MFLLRSVKGEAFHALQRQATHSLMPVGTGLAAEGPQNTGNPQFPFVNGVVPCPVAVPTTANQPNVACGGTSYPVFQILQPVLVSCDQTTGAWWGWPCEGARPMQWQPNQGENVQLEMWEAPPQDMQPQQHHEQFHPQGNTWYQPVQQQWQMQEHSHQMQCYGDMQRARQQHTRQPEGVWQEAGQQQLQQQEQESSLQQHQSSPHEDLCDREVSTTETASEKSSLTEFSALSKRQLRRRRAQTLAVSEVTSARSSASVVTTQASERVEVETEDQDDGSEVEVDALSSMWPLAWTRQGCRVVQEALDSTTGADQVALAEQLKGRVRDAIKSPNANYVLQKCVEVMPPNHIQFVIDELQGHAAATSRHRFGCRILQRLVEHCPSEQTSSLVDEVLREAPTLCRHRFGNFVLQHVLEHGTSDQRRRIVDALEPEVVEFSKHRLASHVVQRALVHCQPEEQQRLVQAISARSDEKKALAHSQYGSFVVREMHARCLGAKGTALA
uniref:PUM-HD domain-containing protein n=1 Tax=Noctiluca scintillans TaxID=2966 RepID=A0A7S1A390_NOCSC